MWQVWEKEEVHTGFWWKNLRERDRLEDQGVDGRIILRRISGSGMVVMNWIHSPIYCHYRKFCRIFFVPSLRLSGAALSFLFWVSGSWQLLTSVLVYTADFCKKNFISINGAQADDNFLCWSPYLAEDSWCSQATPKLNTGDSLPLSGPDSRRLTWLGLFHDAPRTPTSGWNRKAVISFELNIRRTIYPHIMIFDWYKSFWCTN